MTYLGLDPELARGLSLALRQAASDAEGLSDEVVGALLLSELESSLPDQIEVIGEDLDDVGLIVSTRVDVAEGLVIDPVVLAEQLGLTEAQVQQALAALNDESDVNARKNVTPFFQLRANAEAGAEVLRGSFVDLPAPGEDPVLDAALEELGLILPEALVAGEIDIELLTDSQRQALDVLAAAIGVADRGIEVEQALGRLAVGASGDFQASITFAFVAKAFELDQRLAAAAGLPTIEDILFQARVDDRTNLEFDDSLAPLDEFLPALLVGEGEIPTDPADLALTVRFARELGFDGTDFDAALAFLKGGRFLQRSLIPGDFEGVDGPLLVWTEEGVNNALLAGRRNGVLDDVSREQAEFLAANFLTGDGSGDPIELTEELTQALGAIVIGQNGEDFVLENPQIQRQLISAINLIGRQPTLEDQRRLFADAIEAFRSLAVVGAPAMTYRQLTAAVGPEVADELSRKDLTRRSEKGYTKRPQFLTLLNHWGIPGGDTLKLKKYKFSFEFDETGQLSRVRNKKLSKWKRFKNSVKALGKALKQAWKDNPWGVIWEGVKLAAAAVLTVVPGTNAVGAALLYASITVLVADMAYQATKGNWMDALSSGFTALSGGAAYFGQAAAVASAGATTAQAAAAAARTASTAAKVGNFARAGQAALAAIEHGEDFIDAVDDGDVLGAISSGAGALAKGASVFPGSETVGTTSNLIATGANFVSSGVETVNAGIQTYDAIQDGDALQILSSSFNLLSSGLDTIEQGGNFANSASAYLGGVTANQGVLDAAAVDEITGEARRELEDQFTHRVVSSDTLSSLSTFSGYAADAAQLTNISSAVLDGDLIGAAQQGVRFLGSEVGDESTQLALAAADKGLVVASIVESIYRGGAVPDGDDVFTALFELGAAAGAAFAGPTETATIDPRETVRADGSIAIDYDGDGIDDALVGSDGVLLDLDGDGEFDVAFDDTDGDGRGDTRGNDPIPEIESLFGDDPDLSYLQSLAPLDDSTIGSLGLSDITGEAISTDLIRELDARSDAVFQTEDGVRIVRPDGSVEHLTTEQIDAVLGRTERELQRLDEAANPRVAQRAAQERAELEAEIARLKELRLVTPEGTAGRVRELEFAADQLVNTNVSSEVRQRVQLAIDRELQALGRLDQVAAGGQVVGPDGLPRLLVAADLGQIDVPSLQPTHLDRLTANVNNQGDVAGALTAVLQDVGTAGTARQQAPYAEILLQHGIEVVDHSIPGVIFDAAGVAYEVIETGRVAAAGGDATKELVEGGVSVLLGLGLSATGAPGLAVFGATYTTELVVGEVYDRLTYEHQGGTFQLDTGETVTLASTTPSGPPTGIPVSYRIVDDGQSLDTTVNVSVDGREIQLGADQVADLITGNTEDNYENSIDELVRIFEEDGPVRPRGHYRTDAIRALESIEMLTEASSHLLAPGVAELFRQPF